MDQIKANLAYHGRKLENHPLLLHIAKVNRKSVMPDMVYGDHKRLQQVLINLIRNAIDFSFHNGEILISINYDYKDSLLICVINDNGVGIKKKDQNTIFSLL